MKVLALLSIGWFASCLKLEKGEKIVGSQTQALTTIKEDT